MGRSARYVQSALQVFKRVEGRGQGWRRQKCEGENGGPTQNRDNFFSHAIHYRKTLLFFLLILLILAVAEREITVDLESAS
jgi:hypothetical protein